MNSLTSEKRELLEALLNEGMSAREASIKACVHRDTATNVARELGVLKSNALTHNNEKRREQNRKKSATQNAKRKARGHQGRCRICGGPCYQVGGFTCGNCWKRGAKLKLLSKFKEGSPEWLEALEAAFSNPQSVQHFGSGSV